MIILTESANQYVLKIYYIINHMVKDFVQNNVLIKLIYTDNFAMINAQHRCILIYRVHVSNAQFLVPRVPVIVCALDANQVIFSLKEFVAMIVVINYQMFKLRYVLINVQMGNMSFQENVQLFARVILFILFILTSILLIFKKVCNLVPNKYIQRWISVHTLRS